VNRIVDPKNVVLVATKAYAYFAKLLAARLGLDVSPVQRRQFSDGEKYYRLNVNSRLDLVGKDVIIVGGTHTEESLLELVRLGTVATELGTRKRIFVIPNQGYATMERDKFPGESTNSWVYNLLHSIPNVGAGNIFMFLDLHESGQLNHLKRDRHVYHAYAEPVLLKGFQCWQKPEIFGTADVGRPDWVKSYADKFGVEFAVVYKDRNFEQTKLFYAIGDVAGKVVGVYDDMIRSFGTADLAVNAYLAKGATEVFMGATHLTLNNGDYKKALARIERSPVSLVLVTNSHPTTERRAVKHCGKIIVLDVSEVFVQPILAYLK